MIPASAATAAPEGRVERDELLREIVREIDSFLPMRDVPGLRVRGFAFSKAEAEALRDVVTAALAPSTGAGAVAGFKPVPIEPTPEMIRAGGDAIEGGPGANAYNTGLAEDEVERAWSAMLAAAPAAPPREPDAPDGGGVFALDEAKGVYAQGVTEYLRWTEGATDKDAAHQAGLQAIVDRAATLRRATPRDGGTVGAELSQAARDVLAERRWQVEGEGWTPEHDDAHDLMEMARAAVCYLTGNPSAWPWHRDWWKPTTRRRDLLKAGALVLAEIERLDRRVRLATERGEG